MISISNDLLTNKITKHGMTILTDNCDDSGFYLLYRYNASSYNSADSNDLIEYNYNDLHEIYESDNLLSNLYIMQASSIGASCVSANSYSFNGYTVINDANSSDNLWVETESWNGVWIAVCWVYLIFILMTEWLFWSYSTEFTKNIDNIAMCMWGLLRFANCSFMFSVALAFSLMVSKDNVSFLIGDYSNVAIQLCMVTSLVGLTVPVSLIAVFALCACLAICCSEAESYVKRVFTYIWYIVIFFFFFVCFR